MNKRNLTKSRKIAIFILIDLAIVLVSLVFGIKLGSGTPLQLNWDLGIAILVNVVLVYSVFFICNLQNLSLSSIGLFDAVRIIFACAMVAVGNLVYLFITKDYSYSQLVVYIFLLTTLVGLSRFSVRIYRGVVYLHRPTSELKRVLLVGAGESGNQLCREIQNSSKLQLIPVAFVDDDVNKIGTLINGIRVVGTTKEIPDVVKKYNIDEIYIALPSASKKIKKAIVEICQKTQLPTKTLPGMYQLMNGEVQIQSLRPVSIADLLGRDEVKVNLNEIAKYIKNEIVLVTGGGGSIGSELCRQIAAQEPKQLIIFDIYENNAYDIEQELKRHFPSLNLLTLIGSIRDSSKLDDLFKKYQPTIVFNAAAHKHVPLMETSPNEAIKNNAIGTLKLARCADKYKVKTFVQISTDKAVNPTNIMGASKRICEMIIQTIGKNSKNTNFVAVRFGNVLGSNGSVIPLFEKQIKEGGPVTITHKDIIRYFMTIPEAVSLVLEAGAYAKKGQIFVLDMGEPVKIYDLATNLIKLSGLTPGVDIEIKETGLRPGEKLFEERLMAEEGLEKTANGLISVAKPLDIKDEEKFWKDLDELYELAYAETDNMKDVVAKLVPTYIRKK